MAVHGVFVTFKVIAPDKIKQAFTTVTLARVGGQKSDEIKLFWRSSIRAWLSVTFLLSISIRSAPYVMIGVAGLGSRTLS